MNKKGFVLLETIIVLLVTVVSMLGLFLTYSFVFKNLNQGKYYDNINDVYKLNVFYKTMNKTELKNHEFLIIGNSNCSAYFDTNCASLMGQLHIDRFIYLNKNIDDILKNPEEGLLNTDFDYIKQLEHNYSYLIGSYEVAHEDIIDYYYVSLKVGELQ